jgi:hypothetical protein
LHLTPPPGCGIEQIHPRRYALDFGVCANNEHAADIAAALACKEVKESRESEKVAVGPTYIAVSSILSGEMKVPIGGGEADVGQAGTPATTTVSRTDQVQV